MLGDLYAAVVHAFGYATHRQKVDRQRPCPCLFSEANQISIKRGLTGGLLGRSICELVCGPRVARVTQGLCSRRFFPFEIQGEGHDFSFPRNYPSPGHHADGGSIAEIFSCRSATKWLRLNG